MVLPQEMRGSVTVCRMPLLNLNNSFAPSISELRGEGSYQNPAAFTATPTNLEESEPVEYQRLRSNDANIGYNQPPKPNSEMYIAIRPVQPQTISIYNE